MDEIARKIAERLEVDMLAAFGAPKNPPQTALRLRGRAFETVRLDDDGNIIEPPKPCSRCGPFLLCAKHAAMVG
jgi:hypothetical protein